MDRNREKQRERETKGELCRERGGREWKREKAAKSSI